MQQAETTFADLPPAIAEWKRGLLTLRADRSPCQRLGQTARATMLESALDFVDRFGAEAAALSRKLISAYGCEKSRSPPLTRKSL